MFPRLLQHVANRRHVYLVGTAGSGKTTAAKEAARALNLAYYPYSCGPDTREHSLFGMRYADGTYIAGAVRAAYENGGVLLLDEIDTANPAVLTKINAMLANGETMFPDAIVKRHADFVCIAAGNTFGRGADAEFIGRNPLDAATRDRFAFLIWDIDESLERDFVLAAFPSAGTWVDYVQSIRAAVARAHVRLIVSPRASLYGAQDIANGASRDDAAEAFIWRGLGADDRAKITSTMAAR